VINTHKAMLLQTLIFFENSWCKSCDLISRFMKSVFIHKPATPRYVAVWDVSIVLKYLASLIPLSKLSLKLLTFKTIALIALATAPRAQTLGALNLDNMVVEKQAVVFMFSDILKTSKVGTSFSLKIEHYVNESLCAMHTLLYYIAVTKDIRLTQYLFISYVTCRAVTSGTLARWLKCVLQLSGIDVSCYKAHSFRSASTSAAFHKGCSIKDILSTANWKSDNNFRKFYFRHSLQQKDISFSTAVFSSM
jgi:hypothetical protein